MEGKEYLHIDAITRDKVYMRGVNLNDANLRTELLYSIYMNEDVCVEYDAMTTLHMIYNKHYKREDIYGLR